MNRLGRCALLPVLLVFVATGCAASHPWEGTKIDQPGWYACTDLAKAIRDTGGAQGAYALQPAGRQSVAAAYSKQVGGSTTALAKDSAAVLNRTVEGPGSSWKLALDTAAGRCLQLGWDPAKS